MKTAIPFSYSLQNLKTRRMTTLLTAGGIALVIFSFTAVLMLAYGLEKAMGATGSNENGIVVRRGAVGEAMSTLDINTVHILQVQPEIMKDSDGEPMAVAEIVSMINIPKRETKDVSNVLIRGVSQKSFALRKQVRMISGRMVRPGAWEVIVGVSAAERFLGLGEQTRFALQNWTVVGLFEADGAGFESEIWLDVEQMRSALRRSVYSSFIFRLSNPEELIALQKRVEADPRLTVTVKREKDYYGEQSKMMASFIRVLGIFVTIIFSLGAVIGATITLYGSVAQRTREVGTLRAIGFGRRAVFITFLVESLAIAIIGWAGGLFFAVFLQAATFSTVNFVTFSEISFRFALSPAILGMSFLFAILMGCVGGALPALRAARLNIVDALRAG